MRIILLVLVFSLSLATMILAGPLSNIEQLGKIMYQDLDFSFNRTQSGEALFTTHCSKCHAVSAYPDGGPPLFTSYAYENIGLPANPLLSGNPVDYGLGGFLEADFNSDLPLIGDAMYAAHYGKFKIPTLRNIALTPPYGHNGYFPELREMIRFLNSRDVSPEWPAPEVWTNLNTIDVGDMGLTDAQIDDIVQFLHTLSDRRLNRP
ncbi:MAG: c-type cytochrome [Desulfobacteraceae bacterium]|nr:c-type cytochrome [Desulfobacteraceae bacterium]